MPKCQQTNAHSFDLQIYITILNLQNIFVYLERIQKYIELYTTINQHA
jgi:hypothetical protein